MPSRPESTKPPRGGGAEGAESATKAAKADAKREVKAVEGKAGEGRAEPKEPRKWPKGGPTKADLKRYRQMLEELRTGQARDSRELAQEALKASGQDFSVDHMADHGTDNFEQDFTLGLLEGKTEALRDVDEAIAKIDGKSDLPFGLCESCAERDERVWERRGDGSPWIQKPRLDVVPYARLCLRCQEAEEDR
jgi:RNA polymerase-binding transcription factor DksA